MKAAVHPLQAARLAALRSYDILDTPREADFDELVELASIICGTPISVVNLSDENRQWFKAETGLGVRETPLETSICSHAILEESFVEISDTLADRRMSDNPLCLGDPGLRFYAGALLRTPEGLPLGTLCVLDFQTRVLTDFQKRSLQLLARQVMTQMDLRRALKNQTVLMQEIDHRVKNSLQSVSSLVKLQRGASKDDNVRSALDEVSLRLRTVSLVHEELNITSKADEVNLGRYLERLTDLLRANVVENVRIDVAAEELSIDSRRASAVGMIVSEFVSNSLKHAFPDSRSGVISISLGRLSDGRARLLCEDDGIGAPPVQSGARRGLGLRIMDASVSQIGGVSDVGVDTPGFRFSVVFPLGA